MIPFFEGKYDLYLVLCHLIVPIICCIVFYLWRPRLIWLAPLVILCLFLFISAAFYPYFFQDIFKGEYDFTTVYWMMFVVPVEIVASLFFPGITYAIIWWRSERSNSSRRP